MRKKLNIYTLLIFLMAGGIFITLSGAEAITQSFSTLDSSEGFLMARDLSDSKFFLEKFYSHQSLFQVPVKVPLRPLRLCGDNKIGKILTNHKYAWGENVGWVNFRPQNAKLEIGGNILAGWIKINTIGWVYMGDGKPANGYQYSNGSAFDYGVNNKDGILSGWAWCENVGWVNFGSSQDVLRSAQSLSRVCRRNDPSGRIAALPSVARNDKIGHEAKEIAALPSVARNDKIKYAVARNDKIKYTVARNDIKYNGTGVKINKDGSFSGYAWSDNVGRIKFNSGGAVEYMVKTDPYPWKEIGVKEEIKVGSGSYPIGDESIGASSGICEFTIPTTGSSLGFYLDQEVKTIEDDLVIRFGNSENKIDFRIGEKTRQAGAHRKGNKLN